MLPGGGGGGKPTTGDCCVGGSAEGGGETTSDCIGSCAETWIDDGMPPVRGDCSGGFAETRIDVGMVPDRGGGETTSGCTWDSAETRIDVGILLGGRGGETADTDGGISGEAHMRTDPRRPGEIMRFEVSSTAPSAASRRPPKSATRRCTLVTVVAAMDSESLRCETALRGETMTRARAGPPC